MAPQHQGEFLFGRSINWPQKDDFNRLRILPCARNQEDGFVVRLEQRAVLHFVRTVKRGAHWRNALLHGVVKWARGHLGHRREQWEEVLEELVGKRHVGVAVYRDRARGRDNLGFEAMEPSGREGTCNCDKGWRGDAAEA
eukprot:CAMPEP_0172588244 /NCGR_PEP_ID=MMETSP1068-20121228/7176_1 /TAXON_ID=35684 /ORGANISM="Pseudopedinella elastica, Strain CCMP716" /LENGTH=139 /DNA_ID=CAMNT_0013383517 /DNA_START=162 /DNA_END=581 /DNA_ORIENTATION=-